MSGFSLPPLPNAKWNTSLDNNPDYRAARLSADAPRVPWNVFESRLDWRQGEHFGLIGPTGKGKTTMQMALLPLHPYVVVTATKPADPTMDKLIKYGDYVRLEHWRRLNPRDFPRRVIWPNAKELSARTHQREVFLDAFERIYMEGGWTLSIDELWFFTAILGLETEVRIFILQSRSNNISLLMSTQRPSRVPLEVFDQSTHLMFWRENDRRNLDRIGEINARDASLVRAIVRELEEYQVLYVNTRTGQMLRTRVPYASYGQPMNRGDRKSA